MPADNRGQSWWPTMTRRTGCLSGRLGQESAPPTVLRLVENGGELTDYLNHGGKYSDPASSPRPSLILLDLNMPRKDGREALKEIKGDPELRQIPIVILTTSQADEDVRDSYDLGANSVIPKPVPFTALVDVMQVLGNYRIDVVDLGPVHRRHVYG